MSAHAENFLVSSILESFDLRKFIPRHFSCGELDAEQNFLLFSYEDVW